MAEIQTGHLEKLRIIHYPDPRLRAKARLVTVFDPALASLAARMFELMRKANGVGLAAPQIGIPLRLFVMNATGQPGDDLVLVNPKIGGRVGSEEAEEGCLSLPGVNVQIRRAARCSITAQDLSGAEFRLESEHLPARIWQHETDHLDGVLIIDKMSPGDRMAVRKTLKSLEDQYSGDGETVKRKRARG